MESLQIVWFKRDLRLADHGPLLLASRLGPVLPLVVVEPELWRQPDASARQWQFYSECLEELRSDLAALGLSREEGVSETEDHFACVCEVMRYLIAGDDVEVANLTQQQKFFSTHLQPWGMALCDAIEQHPQARFYAALAGFVRAFLSVEAQGFDMLA